MDLHGGAGGEGLGAVEGRETHNQDVLYEENIAFIGFP